MKNFFKSLGLLVVSFISFTSFGQLLSESLTGGSLPAGWSQNSILFPTGAGGYAHFNSAGSTLTTSSFDASPYCGVTVTFDVAKYGSGADGPVTVEYSLDGGSTWTTAGDSPIPTSGTYVSASIAINVSSGNMVIRINRGSSASQKRFRNFVVTEIVCACTGIVAEPTNEVTGEAVTNITCSDADINWTNGVGSDNTLIVMSTSAIAGNPADGVNYAADATFGSGETIAAGEFVVYNGTAGTVSVDGLSPNTTYFIKIFEYNGAVEDCEENYLTGGVTTSFTTTGAPAEPTNEASGQSVTNIACSVADLSWTNGVGSDNTIVVISTSAISGNPVDGTSYTANVNYGTGNTIAAGEYVVYNGSGSAVSITGLSEGITYFIKIFQYNGTSVCGENYLTGGVTTTFTTITGCTPDEPWIQSILYNSCNGNNEGIDEIVTFQTGSNSLDIDDIIIYYPPDGTGNNVTYCNSCVSGAGYTVDAGNVNNQTYVDDLNNLAAANYGSACTIFEYADPIPANSTVMVFTGNPPSTVLDYSSQCGSANLPIYVIFNDNNSISGRFANSAVRDLTIDFGDGTTQTVTYSGGAQGGDGATALYDEDGNVSYFSSNDCVFPLPVELINFEAYVKNTFVSLKWSTASETNNDYFIIEKSENGIEFYEIGKVNGNGNSSTTSNYTFRDGNPSQGVVYYRLKQVDFNGEFNYSFPIKIVNNGTFIYFSENQIHLVSNVNKDKSYLVNIYNINGQVVYSKNSTLNEIIEWNKEGFYIIEIPEIALREKFAF